LPLLDIISQTPSLVPPTQLGCILDTLQQQYGIDPGAEITLEADPGTFDFERLQKYKALGITRISMGVQSFQQVCGGAGQGHSGGLASMQRATHRPLQPVSVWPQLRQNSQEHATGAWQAEWQHRLHCHEHLPCLCGWLT
jgi:hypothetical protein